jgi:hypothetical protein
VASWLRSAQDVTSLRWAMVSSRPDAVRPAGADGALRGLRGLWLGPGGRWAREAPGQLRLVAWVEDLRLA